MGIILLNPIFIIPAGDVFYPVLVVEIPLHGFADACFECFGRFPAEFVVNFCGIDGVAPIVAETIGDIGFGVGPTFRYLLQQQSRPIIF